MLTFMVQLAGGIARQLCSPRHWCAAALTLALPVAGLAAESGHARFGDDYAQFAIGGTDWHPCEHECATDTSCKSWTYILATGQCRLKHTVPPAVANPCCATGVKDEAAVAATAPGKPNDEAECTHITEAAINANNDNLSARCGLTGPLWSSAYDDVYAHCLDSSPDRRRHDAAERGQALGACRQSADLGRGLICDHYARMAMAESATNTQNNCGFDGPEWSGDYNAHVQFCRQAQRSAVADRITGRERQLLECLNRGGAASDPECGAYARDSVGQFQVAQQMRCSDLFNGLGWSRDAGDHYRWCHSHSAEERQALVRRRQEALDTCGSVRDHLRTIFKF